MLKWQNFRKYPQRNTILTMTYYLSSERHTNPPCHTLNFLSATFKDNILEWLPYLPPLHLWSTKFSLSAPNDGAPCVFTPTLHRVTAHHNLNRQQEKWNKQNDSSNLIFTETPPLYSYNLRVKILTYALLCLVPLLVRLIKFL